MAGRTIVGLGQVFLAVAGFVLVTIWFVLTMIQTYKQFTEDAPTKSHAGFGEAGALIFSAAWLWSLVTSLNLLRLAKTPEPAGEPGIPPRIDDVTGGTMEK